MDLKLDVSASMARLLCSVSTLLSSRGAAAPRCKCCNMQISQNICEGHKELVQNLWMFSFLQDVSRRSSQRKMAAPVFGLLSSEVCFHSTLFKLPPGWRFPGKMKPPFPTERICITRLWLNKRKDIVIPRQRWNQCNKLDPSEGDGEDLLSY